MKSGLLILCCLLYNIVLAKDSTKVQKLYNQSQYELEMCRYKNAENLLFEAIQYDSLNLKLRFALANTYHSQNNRKKALETYESILKIDSNNQAAKIQLAKVLIQFGKINSALDLYSKLYIADSTNPYYIKQQAWCYYKNENVDTAIHLYKKAYKIDSTDINTVISLGRLYLNENMITEGNLLCLTHLITDTSNIELYFLYGQLCYKSESIGEAVRYFEKVLLRGDSTNDKLKYAGLAYYDFNKYKKAIPLFQKFLLTEPDNHFILYKLADSYINNDNPDSALFCIQKCISNLEPEKHYHAATYVTMGKAYDLKNMYREAKVCYEKARSLNDEDPECHYRLAYLAEVFEKDADKAIRNYELCVQKIEAKIPPGIRLPGSFPMLDNSLKRIQILKDYQKKLKKN